MLDEYGAIGTHLFWGLVGKAELELVGSGKPDVATTTVRCDKHALLAGGADCTPDRNCSRVEGEGDMNGRHADRSQCFLEPYRV